MVRQTARIALLAFSIVLSGAAMSGTISLEWNELDYEHLAGYKVYYGTQQGALDQHEDVGMATSVTLVGLDDCTNYFVALKAYDGNGVESASFSPAISGWARPEVEGIDFTELEQGATTRVRISGNNLASGATVVLSNSEIGVTPVSGNGCSEIVLDLSVPAGADLGAVDVTVQTPAGPYGASNDLFAVVSDGTAPTIDGLASNSVEATSAEVVWTTDEPASAQVFFRPLGAERFSETEIVSSEGTEHSIQLEGLQPETQYETYVRSVDAAGNATQSASQVLFQTGNSPFEYVRFEAEMVSLTPPLQPGQGSDAFNGGWMERDSAAAASTGAPTEMAHYSFEVPENGDWRLWLRVWSAGGGSVATENVGDAPAAPLASAPAGDWSWVAGRSYDLDAGIHELELASMETGSRIDRVLVTNDPDFSPTEDPDFDVESPGEVAALTAQTQAAEIVLGWTNPSDADVSRVVVRYRADGIAPQTPVDGFGLMDQAAGPGATMSLTHEELTNGTTYSYSVFVIDDAGNSSGGENVEATPQLDPPPPVTGLVRTDVL